MPTPQTEAERPDPSEEASLIEELREVLLEGRALDDKILALLED